MGMMYFVLYSVGFFVGWLVTWYFDVRRLKNRIMEDAVSYSAAIDASRRSVMIAEDLGSKYKAQCNELESARAVDLVRIKNLTEGNEFLSGEVKRLSDLTVKLNEEKSVLLDVWESNSEKERDLREELVKAIDDSFCLYEQTIESYEALIVDLMDGVISREHEILANDNLVTSPKN